MVALGPYSDDGKSVVMCLMWLFSEASSPVHGYRKQNQWPASTLSCLSRDARAVPRIYKILTHISRIPNGMNKQWARFTCQLWRHIHVWNTTLRGVILLEGGKHRSTP